MRAALLAKVKAAGPVTHPRQELIRLQLWWPRDLYPVARGLGYWTERFVQAPTVLDRLAIEEQALADLEQRLTKAPAGAETQLALRFVQQVALLMQESRAARSRARAGAPILLDLEDTGIEALRKWLRHKARLPAQMAVAHALLRLLEAWIGLRRQGLA